MLNIGVFTSNELCAKNICQRISNSKNNSIVFSDYTYEDAKKCNIAIIDLDDLRGCREKLLNDASGLKTIVTVVVSKYESDLETLKDIFKTKKKPILDHDMKNWVRDASELLKNDYLPNLEEDRLYNAIGIKIEDMIKINPDVLQNAKKSFKGYVQKNYKGLSREELIEKFGWKDFDSKKNKEDKSDKQTTGQKDTSETIVKLNKSPKIDFEKEFLENPLTKYRIEKMSKQNMNTMEIIEKLTSITKHDSVGSDLKDENMSDAYILQKVAENKVINDEIKKNTVSRVAKNTTDQEKTIKSMADQGKKEDMAVQERAKQLLTAEQIEKLRKLGVKI